jgi:hypothetical protein
MSRWAGRDLKRDRKAGKYTHRQQNREIGFSDISFIMPSLIMHCLGYFISRTILYCREHEILFNFWNLPMRWWLRQSETQEQITCLWIIGSFSILFFNGSSPLSFFGEAAIHRMASLRDLLDQKLLMMAKILAIAPSFSCTQMALLAPILT